MLKSLITLLFLFPLSAQQPSDKDSFDVRMQEASSWKEIKTVLKDFDCSSDRCREKLYKIPLINPLNPKNVKRISSDYGKRLHPIERKYKEHNGIDMAAEIGTPVHAAAEGVVTSIQHSRTGYGKSIIIQHDYGFTTRYAHMAITFVLKKGQKVRLGEIIGMVGSTGKSTGNHLHYEIIKKEKFLNPIRFIQFANL